MITVTRNGLKLGVSIARLYDTKDRDDPDTGEKLTPFIFEDEDGKYIPWDSFKNDPKKIAHYLKIQEKRDKKEKELFDKGYVPIGKKWMKKSDAEKYRAKRLAKYKKILGG